MILVIADGDDGGRDIVVGVVSAVEIMKVGLSSELLSIIRSPETTLSTKYIGP